MNTQKVKLIEQWPKKAGKSDYLHFLRGERLTQRQAIKAKCYDCCGGNPDVCSVRHCPLLPFNNAIHKRGNAGRPRTYAASE